MAESQLSSWIEMQNMTLKMKKITELPSLLSEKLVMKRERADMLLPQHKAIRPLLQDLARSRTRRAVVPILSLAISHITWPDLLEGIGKVTLWACQQTRGMLMTKAKLDRKSWTREDPRRQSEPFWIRPSCLICQVATQSPRQIAATVKVQLTGWSAKIK